MPTWEVSSTPAWDASGRTPQPSRSTIFRTGRLLTPSMPVISSAFACPAAAAVVTHVRDEISQGKAAAQQISMKNMGG